MKNFLGWMFRLLCIAIIGCAAATVCYSISHMNDDHTVEALLGTGQTSDFGAETAASGSAQETLAASSLEAEEAVEENPSVVLYSNGAITIYRSSVTVTAAFGDIVNSIDAELRWYVDGELVKTVDTRTYVDGSTVSCAITDDVTEEGADALDVTLEIDYGGETLSADTSISVHRQEETLEAVRTEEIPVTAKKDSSYFTTSDLTAESGIMAEGETAYLIDYVNGYSGPLALELQFSDGNTGWVAAGSMEVGTDDYTTDTDYNDTSKNSFVNDRNYDSQTDYLIWISLYTQKVNVFTGYQGSWTVSESFDCATGSNTTPTIIGVFTYTELADRWILSSEDRYVAPAMVFNGGQALISGVYDLTTNKLLDGDISTPCTGGSVRLGDEDIAWLSKHIPVGTTIVVY